MPELARFDGIIIRMYAESGGQHHQPHFHAYHGRESAVYGLDPLAVLAGELPAAQHRKVLAWAGAHLRELLAAWADLQAGRTPQKLTR